MRCRHKEGPETDKKPQAGEAQKVLLLPQACTCLCLVLSELELSAGFYRPENTLWKAELGQQLLKKARGPLHAIHHSASAHNMSSLMNARAPDISHGACAGTAPVPKSKLKSGFRSEPLPAATITNPKLLEFRRASSLARTWHTTSL